MKLHENIRARRIALKMTQQELAQRIGYKSTSTMAKIESGENDIPQAKIVPFANALNTTPAALIGLEPREAELLILPEDTVNVVISSGKPQLEKAIAKLDNLSERNLDFVLSVINPLIKRLQSGEDYDKTYRIKMKSVSRPVE